MVTVSSPWAQWSQWEVAIVLKCGDLRSGAAHTHLCIYIETGEARGRMLLTKIVGCYIPCWINLYGCIGYIYSRKGFFSVMFFLVWVGHKNIVIFMKFSFQNDSGQSNSASNQWLTPCQTQLGMLLQDGSTRLYWSKWLIKLCMASMQINVIKK